MCVSPAKAQGSVNPDATGFTFPQAPSSRYLCAVPKPRNLMQQPWLESTLAEISFG